jgi:OOP family OmpA-OmpF porin
MNPIKQFFMATLFIMIASCSSKPVIHEYPPSASPADEIASLEKDLNIAKDKQIDILSPKNYKEAKDSLVEAKKNFLDGKDSQKTLHQVATSRAYLNSAKSVADIARDKMEDVIESRQLAIEADAKTYFNKDLKRIDEDLAEVTRAIEKNKMHSSKENLKLQQKYTDLEIKSIQEKHLRTSRELIIQAKNENAKKYAPRTLAAAEKSYNDTEFYIKMNPHNTIEITDRARATNNAANHVFNINRVAKNTSKVSSEEMAILVEKEKNLAMKSQEKLNMTKDELETTQSALEKEKETQLSLAKTAEELASEKDKLEAEKSLNEKYEEARKTFSSNEAEVYKQGDALLIRLKGIEFPSAKATIQSKSYPLLSKVEKVVEEFGAGAEVTISGHTDSIGGKTVNNRLSKDRALAVKEYLQANGGGIETNIETTGYGDEKPLATNKTASGRAQNRRVDIIIKPDTSKL